MQLNVIGQSNKPHR